MIEDIYVSKIDPNYKIDLNYCLDTRIEFGIDYIGEFERMVHENVTLEFLFKYL